METEIYLDEEDTDTQKIVQKYPELLPLFVGNIFGYDVPIYIKVGRIRRFFLWLFFGIKLKKIR